MVTASEPNILFPKDLKEYDSLMERTKRGDETTLPVLREMLTEPLIVEIWGNMAAYAERSLIRKLSGNDLAIREGLHRKMESLRAELAGPTPSPLERLLVERIVVCWLHLYRLGDDLRRQGERESAFGRVLPAQCVRCPQALPVRHQDAGRGPQTGPARTASEHRQQAREGGRRRSTA